jgi:hypothetical protein
MRPIVGRAAGLTTVDFGLPVSDHALSHADPPAISTPPWPAQPPEAGTVLEIALPLDDPPGMPWTERGINHRSFGKISRSFRTSGGGHGPAWDYQAVR